jgi:hypothetical protein
MRFARLCQYGAALLWAIACHADAVSTDGNTSWVSMCNTSADCSGKMTCECGVCTNVCAMDAVCGDGQRACAKAGSPAFGATCGEGSTLAGVCLPRCSKQSCGPGRVCTRGLCTPSVVVGPLSDSGPAPDGPPGTGGTAGRVPGSGGSADALGSGGSIGTGPASATCDSFDDPRYRDEVAVSFRNDLLPIFGLSCVVSDCHSPRDRKAGLNLGYKCAYDFSARWKCTFPIAGDSDPTKPQPDDEQVAAQIYADLLAPARTVNGGRVQRVVPGDPANSFLVLKLADKQNTRGYACINQDVSHETDPPPCGVAMPQNGDVFCAGTYQERFNAIVFWIAQGAKNN